MVTLEGIMQSIWTWIVTFISDLLPVYILPNLQLIIQIIILLIVGYIAGRIGKVIVTKLLSIAGLKKVTSKTWTESVLKVTGYKGTTVELIGDLVKWLIYILFLAVIVETIGLTAVADIFTQIAGFMPRFIGAILIIVVGFIIADFFGRAFEEAGRKLFHEEILASLSGGILRYSIAVIVVIMALGLVGIDSTSLTAMFVIILATMMVSLLIGIRDILPNYSAGIALKKTIKPGDYVKTGMHSGIVEKMNALSVILKNGKKRSIVPNSELLNKPFEKKD